MEPATSAQLASSAPSLLNFGLGLATSALNVHEARASRRFARDQSNTEMQRRVQDLYKAGLNPALAIHGGFGQGASSAGAQAAHIEAPRLDIMQQAQGVAAIRESSARSIEHLANAGVRSTENLYLQESIEDRLMLQRQQLLHELERRDLTREETLRVRKELSEVEARIEQINVQTKHHVLDLERAKAESDMYRSLGIWAPILERGGPALSSAAAAASVARLFGRGASGTAKKVGKFGRIVDKKTGEVFYPRRLR